MIQCQLFKIILQVTFPESEYYPIFWAYHMTEALARDASLRWGEDTYPGMGVSIQKVDLVK